MSNAGDVGAVGQFPKREAVDAGDAGAACPAHAKRGQ